MNSFIPKVVIKRKVDDQPWFTDKCAIACANKEKAWRALKKYQSEKHKQQYNQIKLYAQAVYAQARSQYLTSIKSKLSESGNNSKVWWHIVNHVCGKGGHTEMPTLQLNGQLYDSAVEKAEILKDIFVSKSSLSDDGKNPPLLPNYAHDSLNTVKILLRWLKRS
jgi:hypothetical protein